MTLTAALLGVAGLTILVMAVLFRRRVQKQEAMLAFLREMGTKLLTADSPAEVAEALSTTAGRLGRGTTLKLHLYTDASNTLDLVPTENSPQVRSLTLRENHQGSAAKLAECFQTGKQVTESNTALVCYIPLQGPSGALGVIEIAPPASMLLNELLCALTALAIQRTRRRNADSPVAHETSPAADEPVALEKPISKVQRTQAEANNPKGRELTLLLVDPDAQARAELLERVAVRGHRVVPSAAEQAADLARRLRFDAVIWAVRSDGWKWSDYQDRLRDVIPAYILVSSGYDTALADSLRASGGFLLSRPVEESELAEILTQVTQTLTLKQK